MIAFVGSYYSLDTLPIIRNSYSTGFMLPYHFGTVAALRDFGVTFTKATASSGGVMAALALLGGADLHLGVRQCFDLRDEKATTPGSIRSFFAVYREYFRCFRNPAFQRSLRLSELRDRLYVRLGRWTSKGWEIYQVNDMLTQLPLHLFLLQTFTSPKVLTCQRHLTSHTPIPGRFTHSLARSPTQLAKSINQSPPRPPP
jgi:hypothetical protein